jgi:hypothetical protein
MTNRIRGTHAVALAVLALAAVAPAAAAAPATINLRVEGVTGTIYEGPITTDGHKTTSPSDGQPRDCDGTNAGNPPGPTPTSALDDASRLAGFTWDGRWGVGGYQDYLIDRIGSDAVDNSHFWSLWVNWKFADLGGCGQRVNQGDEVLWAYEDLNASPLLRISGPGSARTGESFRVRVVDGLDGSPEQGAVVSGATTGPDGEASLSFASAGIYRLKAEKPDAIRSNAHVLCVDPPGAEPCTSADKSAPTVQVTLPGRELASEQGQSRTLVLSWLADDAAGAGVSHYAVEVREVANGLRTSKIQPGEWKVIADRTQAPTAQFRGSSGKAYQFRITAVDRAANRGSVETQPLVLPVDDRDRRLWRFSPGQWRRKRNQSAWGRTVMHPRHAGARATFPFTGRRVSLIGRKLPRGGRLRVTVAGRSKVLRLRGRSAHRSVLWTSRGLRDGAHTLRVRTLGGGPVELDAVAPRP